ncbi:winged helix-turn-helix domain-containing protein [Novosphingobium sp.]|uniref:winged helix-turn-helix domain-containing protein n=1 Tax=Novosphingobium sp. TaxID=1874826 RepID=UPI0025EFFE7F|nr:winged helix-turn-helix domain-containing protein [Novosphingobium sp.]
MPFLREFSWLAAGPVPAVCDLRRLGWRLRRAPDDPGPVDPCPLLAVPSGLPFSQWLSLTGGPSQRRRATAMLGIEDAQQRSRLLRMGFGEAFGWPVSLDELAVRIERMTERALTLPRRRRIGTLLLDMVARDGFVAGRPIGLHPREFALLWRLGEQPGYAVSGAALLCDVWRLSFRPETNSLAVHVSRLRAKLRIAGLDGLIETAPHGGYRLAVGLPADFALDGYARMGKERAHETS